MGRNNKDQNPGEELHGRSAPKVAKRGDGVEEEDEEELAVVVVGRAMYCNKEKSEQDKEIHAGVGVEKQTQRETKSHGGCRSERDDPALTAMWCFLA